jgi:DNA polymerase-1
VDADYSQIEVRVYAKIVGETALLNLFDNDEVDVYRATAANMLGVEESEISGEERQKAKAIMLGLLYGLSHVGLPAYAFKGYGVVIQPEEAEDLIERFFDLYPNIAIDHESANAALREFGSVDRETLTGRRRDYIDPQRSHQHAHTRYGRGRSKVSDGQTLLAVKRLRKRFHCRRVSRRAPRRM